MLTHLDSNEMLFTFSSPTRAAIVSPGDEIEGEDVLMLVMPVQL